MDSWRFRVYASRTLGLADALIDKLISLINSQMMCKWVYVCWFRLLEGMCDALISFKSSSALCSSSSFQ